MAFAGILDGNYVVWHGVTAQIDAKLVIALTAFDRCDIIMGVNKYNSTPNIRVFSRPDSGAPYTLAGQLTPASMPLLPADGTFVDVVFSGTFAPRVVGDVRIVITKDGVEPQELTPVKKYMFFNSGIQVVGNSRFQINDLGWQTGEVFKTIFKYLEAPISVEHTVDIVNETSGLLPESRVRNDNILARVADNELITGFWDFENGQLMIERGTSLPPVAKSGRLFYRTDTKNLFLGDGASWIRLIKEGELLRSGVYSSDSVHFSVHTSSVFVVTIPAGATIKRTHINITEVFNDQYASVFVGTAGSPSLLADTGDLHLQRLGDYELDNDIQVDSAVDIRIVVSTVGTEGAGDVSVEYSVD